MKAIIFDLDGTLVDTIQDLADATEFVLREMGVAGGHSLADYKKFVGNGVVLLLERAFAGAGVPHFDLERARALFDQYYWSHCTDHTLPYPGVLECLEQLKQAGVPLGIVTNKPDPFARKIAETYFDGTFQQVFGQQEGVPKKPDPSSALQMLKKLGCNPAESVFVGDGETDMQTAKNAGMGSVGCLWGFRTPQILVENGAQALAGSPAELAERLLHPDAGLL